MEAKTPVHTIVLHRLPDLEALYMVWLVAMFGRLRKWLGVDDDFQVKFIPSGLLRKDDWVEEIRRQDDVIPSVLRMVGERRSAVSPDAIRWRGYLFLDCGRGGPFDQHVAAENRGRAQDEVASVDLLMQMSKLPDHEPSVLPFLRVVSDNDRTGNSVCRQPPFDKRCDTPHVPRDLRTMITTLNELHPEHPQVVMETFFMAMSGLEHRFLALHDEWTTGGGEAPDENTDLREMNFLTVDNAAQGLPGYLETLESYRGKSELIVAKVAAFWKEVRAAWQQRERDWQQGVKDHGRQTTKRFEAVYRPRTSDGNGDGEDRGEKHIKVTMGFSVSHQFPTVARAQGADLVVQLYEEGRLMVTRRGTRVGLNHIARMLRYADACKRRGTIIVPRDWGARNTVSVVRLQDGRNLQTFFFAGFAFGNYFRSNREGQVRTVLNPQEIVDTVLAALMDEPFETVDRILGFRPRQERDGARREGRR